MKIFYKITVNPEPNYHDSPDKPYSWMIASIDIDNPNSTYCNSGFGRAETPEKAFEEALNYYNKYKKKKGE